MDRTRTSVLQEVRLHSDVSDEKAVAKSLALAFMAERLANEAARAVGGHQIVAGERIGAVRCTDLQRDRVAVLDDAGNLVLPTDFEIRQFAGALEQIALDVILLEVDEGRAMVALFRQKVEAVDLVFVKKDAALVPADAFRIIGSPQPRRSKISRVRFAKQMARDPVERRSSSSRRRTSIPFWARSIAVASPMGPAPTTTTRRCVGAPEIQFRDPRIGERQGLIVDLLGRRHGPFLQSNSFLARSSLISASMIPCKPYLIMTKRIVTDKSLAAKRCPSPQPSPAAICCRICSVTRPDA